MDRNQHITQDAAEHYAVYLMARSALELGVGNKENTDSLWGEFQDYLSERSWRFEEEFVSFYPEYKNNADNQIPKFLQRLTAKFTRSIFRFEIDEANYRNSGKKADFRLFASEAPLPFEISLKNYIGAGGVERPQVSSGTFLSFAAGFVFERNGVGTYADPREPDKSFSGSNKDVRTDVLRFLNREELINPLNNLEDLQQHVRTSLLNLKFYDSSKVKKVINEIVPSAQNSILEIFAALGEDTARKKFLERVGMAAKEEILFFDGKNSVDSITNSKFHELVSAINSPEVSFKFKPQGQGIRFTFEQSGSTILSVDVPLTVNTNGAWHRPKIRYTGTELKSDKGHLIPLAWGELRPYKSREIATSTNAYVNLKATGIFNP